MAATRSAFALLAIVPLTACALAGPLIDPGMDDAPLAACSNFAAAAAGQADAGQCFTLLERGPTGGFVARSSTQLEAGDEVFAAKSAAPSCQGAFSHLVVGGDTVGPGRMRLDVMDAVGRGGVGRTVDWEETRSGRRWAVADIDAPLHLPGGVRIEMIEGEVNLSSLCYKSYGDIDL